MAFPVECLLCEGHVNAAIGPDLHAWRVPTHLQARGMCFAMMQRNAKGLCKHHSAGQSKGYTYTYPAVTASLPGSEAVSKKPPEHFDSRGVVSR